MAVGIWVLLLMFFKMFKVPSNIQCNTSHAGFHPEWTKNNVSPHSPYKCIFQLNFSSKLLYLAGNNHSPADQPLGLFTYITILCINRVKFLMVLEVPGQVL